MEEAEKKHMNLLNQAFQAYKEDMEQRLNELRKENMELKDNQFFSFQQYINEKLIRIENKNKVMEERIQRIDSVLTEASKMKAKCIIL